MVSKNFNNILGKLEHFPSMFLQSDFKTKAKLFIALVNICLFVVMIICLFNLGNKSPDTLESVASSSVSPEEEEKRAEIAMNAASDNMNSVYYNLVQGTSAKLNEYTLNFEYGGTFNGFFDDNNPDVTGYKYTVTELADGDTNSNVNAVANLNIYNRDMSVRVTYKLVFDSSSNDFPLLLYYPAAKLYIALSES